MWLRFVSHAWLEPVCKFVACLKHHASLRQLPDQTAYWVCAYANNNHQLENEICNNPRKTSFYRAIKLCAGVLLVLDQNATPFTRTFAWKWENPLLLDVAATENGRAHVITDGLVGAVPPKVFYSDGMYDLRYLEILDLAENQLRSFNSTASPVYVSPFGASAPKVHDEGGPLYRSKTVVVILRERMDSRALFLVTWATLGHVNESSASDSEEATRCEQRPPNKSCHTWTAAERGSCEPLFVQKIADLGWGFVECNGQDIFLHKKELKGLCPREGDEVQFTVGETEKGAMAKHVRILRASEEPRYYGEIKSYNPNRGFGFISCDAFPDRDIFVLWSDLPAGFGHSLD
eukprot:s162_g36.t1